MRKTFDQRVWRCSKVHDEFASVSPHFLKSHLVVTCFIATRLVSLIILLSSLLHWFRNLVEPAPIHGVVHCLAEWLSRVPLQAEEDCESLKSKTFLIWRWSVWWSVQWTRRSAEAAESSSNVESSLSRGRRDRDFGKCVIISTWQGTNSVWKEESSRMLWKESSTSSSRWLYSIIWGWGGHGHKKLGKEKLWYCTKRNQPTTWVTKTGAVSGESMGWSSSRRKQ